MGTQEEGQKVQRLNCRDHLQCRCIVTYYQGEQKGFLGYALKSARAESYQGEQFLGYARKSARAESTKENNMLLKRTCFMHVLCECQFHMYNNC